MADNVIVRVPEQQFIRGEDGYSPVVTVEDIEHGHRVTITDREHPVEGQSFDVMDGASAYEQAADGGYSGTEAEFNEELANFKEYAQQANYARSDAITAANTAGSYSSQARQAIGQAQSAMNGAQRAASSASESATSASGSETAAASSATAAAGSASDAATAKTAAEAAQTAAEAARDAAASSATDAAGSVEDAETAKSTAQEAAQSALNESWNATQQASYARAARTAAEMAQHLSQEAKGKAEDAKAAAEAAKTATETARDTAISTLQTEGAAQKTAIQQKGDDVLESIPSDYTDLTEDVSDLKSAVDNKAPAIIGSTSGTIASFDDGAVGVPFKNLSVDIDPVQDAGTPTPETPLPISGRTEINIYRNVLPSKFYTNSFSGGGLTVNATESGHVSVRGTSTGITSFDLLIPFTALKNKLYFKVNTNNTNVLLFVFDQTTVKAVSPGGVSNYSGIVNVTVGNRYALGLRPTGENRNCDCDFDVILSYLPIEENTINIQFPASAGNVHAGTLSIDANDTAILKTRPYYSSYNGETLVGPWVSSMDVYSQGSSPTIGAQVVDLGGTGSSYTFSAKQITSMQGKNDIWADCGKTNIEYCVDKVDISILFIGNSVLQDAVSYLPYLLKTYYPQIKFKFYLWYCAGHTLAQQYSKFSSNSACDIFSVAENSASWNNYDNSSTIDWILSAYKFDIVCMEEYFNDYTEYSSVDDWNNCQDYIQSHYAGGNGLEFITFFHAPKRSKATAAFDLTKAGNELFIKETIAEDMIPAGIAIYDAMSTSLDELGDDGHLSNDGTHAQEGLPCLLQAFVTLKWVLDHLSINKSIYGSQARITTDIYNTIDVPGPNLGSGVITGTTEQNLLAQKIAIKAYKQGKSIVESALSTIS